MGEGRPSVKVTAAGGRGGRGLAAIALPTPGARRAGARGTPGAAVGAGERGAAPPWAGLRAGEKGWLLAPSLLGLPPRISGSRWRIEACREVHLPRGRESPSVTSSRVEPRSPLEGLALTKSEERGEGLVGGRVYSP